jgi:hypothetical protein
VTGKGSLVKDSLLPPPPHSTPLPDEDVVAARRLTEALVELAAEHARDHGVRDSVIVSALITALGSVGAAVAKARRLDRDEYLEFIAGYLARVFESESRQPVYH